MTLPRSVYFYFTLLAIASFFVLFFAKTRALNIEQHNQRTSLMLQLRQTEGMLDRHTLQVASFLLVQYDPLVQTRHRLHALVAELNKPELQLSKKGKIVFDNGFKEYQDALTEKFLALERLKSTSALVRNGLHYIPMAVEELLKIDAEEGELFHTLLAQLLHYNLLPTKTEALRINQKIEELEEHLKERSLDPQFNNVLFHIQKNLELMRKMTQWQDKYLQAPTANRFNSFYSNYVAYFTATSNQAEKVNQVLLAVTILFFLALGWSMRNLIVARQHAQRSWQQLHEAVTSLAEAFALFDSDGRLLLHNDKFLVFYPWLSGKLGDKTSLNEIIQENEQSNALVESKSSTGSDCSLQSPWDGKQQRSYIEHLEDGRWYMASDTSTSTGETVCVRVDITESKHTEHELRKLHRALEQSPASVVITNTDGIIEYVNPKFEEMTGYTAAEAVGENPRILKSGDKSSEEYKDMWETISAGKVWRGQFHNKRKDGEIFWEAASISPVRNDEDIITHYIAVKEDITAQKRAEDQLRLNATVFETTNEGIMVTDGDNRIKTVNPAFSRITGYDRDEVIGCKPDILSSGRHKKEFYTQMWKQLKKRNYWSGEIWDRRKDGSIYPEWLSLAVIRDKQGEIKEHVAVFSDISQRKEDEKQIRFQANYDALTGLPNRTLMGDRLAHAINTAQRKNSLVALLFLDLDRFKAVNDTLGHVAGDELLQMVAERLRACLRDSDTVARFGGDEFAIILEHIRLASDAAEVAEKVVLAMREPFQIMERPVYIGASVGITIYPSDCQDANAMLRHADMAMYQAKENGRDTYHFFTQSMNEEAHRLMDLERDLRQALERDELLMYYQPIISLKDNRMVSMEALLRWQHPERGLVGPDEFIELVEETGLICPIGRWVIHTACRQVKEWSRDNYDCRVCVNLSSRQLALGLSTTEIAAMLNSIGFPPDNLTLEITESMFLHGAPEVLKWLETIQVKGVTLAIDDFGTGYSSLSYLQRLPVDYLKIDRSFVKKIPHDHASTSLVEAIVAMAHNLDLKVVAEGVETEEQLDFLRKLGCDHAQGYLFSRPVPIADIVNI